MLLRDAAAVNSIANQNVRLPNKQITLSMSTKQNHCRQEFPASIGRMRRADEYSPLPHDKVVKVRAEKCELALVCPDSRPPFCAH